MLVWGVLYSAMLHNFVKQIFNKQSSQAHRGVGTAPEALTPSLTKWLPGGDPIVLFSGTSVLQMLHKVVKR